MPSFVWDFGQRNYAPHRRRDQPLTDHLNTKQADAITPSNVLRQPVHDWQRVLRFGATALFITTVLTLIGLVIGPRRARVGVLLFGLDGLSLFGHACPGRHLLGPLHGSGGGAADGGGGDHDLRGLACAPTRRGIWSRIAPRDWAPAGNSRMRICRSLGPIADCARKGGVRGLRANGANPAGSERLRQSRRRLS
jgi:hypothetical protein